MKPPSLRNLNLSDTRISEAIPSIRKYKWLYYDGAIFHTIYWNVDKPESIVYGFVSNNSVNTLDLFGLIEFDYPEPIPLPGNQPESVATVDIELTGKNLCRVNEFNSEITITVEITSVLNNFVIDNFNYVASQYGAIEINGARLLFPVPPPGTPNSRTASVSLTIPQSKCPIGPQNGSGEIKIIDLDPFNQRPPGISGVAQTYDYNWSYECIESSGTLSAGCCFTRKEFEFDVDQTGEDTAVPNL